MIVVDSYGQVSVGELDGSGLEVGEAVAAVGESEGLEEEDGCIERVGATDGAWLCDGVSEGLLLTHIQLSPFALHSNSYVMGPGECVPAFK